MYNKGDPMRARAYSRAAESISKYSEPVTDPKVLKSVYLECRKNYYNLN